ncbi:MAG: hypothetical protein ACLU4P_00095 [Ruminococcus sp.]
MPSWIALEFDTRYQFYADYGDIRVMLGKDGEYLEDKNEKPAMSAQFCPALNSRRREILQY